MLFNSIEFAIFLPFVFLVYWFLLDNKIKMQNIFLLIASYVFYGWWDWRFLSLIIISSLIDFSVGKKLSQQTTKKKKRFWLGISLVSNLGLLGFFKYFNFFLANISTAFTLFGMPLELPSLRFILPVGISFYTFQTLSYSIDIYKGKIKPTNDFTAFFAFVSFFPQLVAGPIERARDLLPQFLQERTFDYNKAVDGCRQILWGLFKKIVIADQCGIFVNDIYTNYEIYKGSTILLGTVFFAFQIYGDFSGYSDIAIGVSRLFGFQLSRNFAFPYFSRDIAEFWRRWHISLTTWFRDYVYIPLGGSKVSTAGKVRNTFIVFLVSGFWHGANWTFIAWGALNAFLFLPLLLTNKNRKHLAPNNPETFGAGLLEALKIVKTFLLITITWVFFRAQTIGQAMVCLQKIVSLEVFTKSEIWPLRPIRAIAFLLIVEWLQRKKSHGLEDLKFNVFLRWFLYLAIITMCLAKFNLNAEFIYFQF